MAGFLRKTGFMQTRCASCLAPFTPDTAEKALCPHCEKKIIPYEGPRCKLCGDLPENGPYPDKICPQCRLEKPPWTAFAYYGLYEGLLRDLLLRFKFDGQLYLSRLLGAFLLDISACLPVPDLITAIPQHASHLRKRGYNQAHEIARIFCNLAGYPLSAKLLKRIRKGSPQEGLPAAERRLNLAGAFTVGAQVRNCDIWIIDDILTTGATCREAAKTLLAAGASSVSVLHVARTSLN